MRIHRSPSTSILGIAAVLALGAAACANESTTPASLVLSQVQADSLAEQVSFDAEDEASGATITTGASAGAAASFSGSGLGGLSHCTPTRTPASPGDADGDGVPDSVHVDFTGCVLSFPLETDTVRGTIDVLDPTQTVSDHAVERIFTGLARVRVYTISGKFTSETRNGTRLTSRDATTLSNTETNFRTDYVFRNGGTATHVKTWTSRFTADVAGSIAPDQPLPSGSWTIAGTSSWTRGPNAYSLTATTNPPLHYDASCTEAPRFDAGTLTIAVLRNARSATVTIQFTACGQYAVTRG
ncbi:MAG TPA: hypothetical protein VLV16_04015 [Gemmatimonadales bacterium]|nr:hypothetical protein [Gemmatimonadales bacterium]